MLKGYAVNQRLERLEQRVSKTEEQIGFYVKYFTMMESYPYYYIKDHLGSVRQTCMRPTSTNKFLEQEMQYYPSGQLVLHNS